MTTPVAITLNTATALPASTAAADAGKGSPFADILAQLSAPGSRQALLQALQQPGSQTEASLPSTLNGRLAQMSAEQRQALLASLQSAAHTGSVIPALQTSDAVLALPVADSRGKETPDTTDAATQQAIAALLAMLPSRPGEAQTFIPGNAQTPDHDNLMHLLSAHREPQDTSLMSLVKGTPVPSADNGHNADITPLLHAKASATTPGINTIDTASTLVSLNGNDPQTMARDSQSHHHGPAITPTVLHTAMPVSATPQPSATPLASAATASAPLLSAPLGSGEWQQALGQQVLMFTRNGQHQAELRLHPQDLGAVQISLRLDDNQAQLHMVAAHSQVRAALEAALPHLRTALAESGIQLGQSSIGSDAQPQWGNAPQQDQGQETPAGALSFAVADNTALGATVPTLSGTARRHLGSVDISV